jgi:hypothetical protein
MARRNRPYDPAKAERDAEKARLIAMGAQLVLDRGGKVVSARRSNAFNLLLQRGTITADHYDAAYTLANEWAIWKGLDGKGERTEFVDGGSGCAELVTDRMIRAGKSVARTMAELDALSQVVMEAFMVATVEEDRPMSWRGIMERLGIKAPEKQTRLFVASCEALRKVYQEPGRVAA